MITHIDNDHFSRPTCHHLKDVCSQYYAPNYVADVMNEEGLKTEKHDINDCFQVQNLSVQLTPAWHNWQNGSSKWQYRYWRKKITVVIGWKHRMEQSGYPVIHVY